MLCGTSRIAGGSCNQSTDHENSQRPSLARALVEACSSGPPAPATVDVGSYRWERTVDDTRWGGRAGLRAVELDGTVFLLGGRTPRQSTVPGDSDIWADVWRSDDLGRTWDAVVGGDDAAPWPARAYFQAVAKDGALYVLGGQDFGLEEYPFCELLEQGLKPPAGLGIDPDVPCPEFLPTSAFFNDVWSSIDGRTWEQKTESAPWEGHLDEPAFEFAKLVSLVEPGELVR